MSLINRLSLFFLASLAVVLAGFSLAICSLAKLHLEARLDERLATAMTALVAAVEVHPGDVQWEPLERRISIGDDAGMDQPRWAVHDHSGRLRDCSRNLSSAAGHTTTGSAGWQLLIRRLRAGDFLPQSLDGSDTPVWVEDLSDTTLGNVSAVGLPDDRTFLADGLTITVGVSREPLVGMLSWLTLTTASISLVTWIVAALFGRWLCDRMLRPISQMAVSARMIRHGGELTQPFEVPATHDELEDLGRAFNELLTELRDSLERQKRFAGDASHQLRTPLTAMLASVDVTLRQDRSPTEYKRALEVVRRRGGQLNQIIESLLFLARAEGGVPSELLERTDLNEWCQEWLAAWADHPRANDISLRQPAERAIVTTRPALLRLVMDNLLENAFKYSESGTPVEVTLDAVSDRMEIAVRDAGWGIAPEQRSLIFEPFYRTREARWNGQTGAGLGLSVVNRLSKILDGKVEVVSELGKGSRFTLILPIDPRPSPGDQSAGVIENGEPEAASSQSA